MTGLTADELLVIARASAESRGCVCSAAITITEAEPRYRIIRVEHDQQCPASEAA